jgi:Ca2+-binding EF-hand superfamily protein
MLAVIDPRVTFYEAKHIFQAVDDSKDGFIQFDEFKSLF